LYFQFLGESQQINLAKCIKIAGLLGGAPHLAAIEAITSYLSARNRKVVVLIGHAD
jgi:hypothetical protein